jgi:hypothetical protein
VTLVEERIGHPFIQFFGASVDAGIESGMFARCQSSQNHSTRSTYVLRRDIVKKWGIEKSGMKFLRKGGKA